MVVWKGFEENGGHKADPGGPVTPEKVDSTSSALAQKFIRYG